MKNPSSDGFFSLSSLNFCFQIFVSIKIVEMTILKNVQAEGNPFPLLFCAYPLPSGSCASRITSLGPMASTLRIVHARWQRFGEVERR
jgi:hypothetical protein